jgi:hypothetical protein
MAEGEGGGCFVTCNCVFSAFYYPVFLWSTTFIHFAHLCVVCLATLSVVLLQKVEGKGEGEAVLLHAMKVYKGNRVIAPFILSVFVRRS